LKISNEGNTILLKGKCIVVEIHITWDCFHHSNFYISRKNIIEWNNIHLLHAGERNMDIYSSKYPIPWAQRMGEYIFTFPEPHATHVLLYRMKPRKHIHVKYCWQAYVKSIRTLSHIYKSHCNGGLQVMHFECLWRFPVKERKLWRENPRGIRRGGICPLLCVITCSEFYPLSNQINIFMAINIWGIMT
jgi:diadenosine tetraphosphatase ApaH/serine/threonine PP2A family protein phosphatase